MGVGAAADTSSQPGARAVKSLPVLKHSGGSKGVLPGQMQKEPLTNKESMREPPRSRYGINSNHDNFRNGPSFRKKIGDVHTAISADRL
jgi:hypothetical protein